MEGQASVARWTHAGGRVAHHQADGRRGTRVVAVAAWRHALATVALLRVLTVVRREASNCPAPGRGATS